MQPVKYVILKQNKRSETVECNCTQTQLGEKIISQHVRNRNSCDCISVRVHRGIRAHTQYIGEGISFRSNQGTCWLIYYSEMSSQWQSKGKLRPR